MGNKENLKFRPRINLLSLPKVYVYVRSTYITSTIIRDYQGVHSQFSKKRKEEKKNNLQLDPESLPLLPVFFSFFLLRINYRGTYRADEQVRGIPITYLTVFISSLSCSFRGVHLFVIRE